MESRVRDWHVPFSVRFQLLPASGRASTIIVSGTRAMRVGLKLSSALHASSARRRRPRHRGSSFSFPIPARHTSHQPRPSGSNKHQPSSSRRGLYSGTYGSTFPSLTYPICGHRARSRAFVVSSLRISSILSICDSPASEGCRAAPHSTHSPRVIHTGHVQRYPAISHQTTLKRLTHSP